MMFKKLKTRSNEKLKSGRSNQKGYKRESGSEAKFLHSKVKKRLIVGQRKNPPNKGC